jgi:hypothetical protein
MSENIRAADAILLRPSENNRLQPCEGTGLQGNVQQKRVHKRSGPVSTFVK